MTTAHQLTLYEEALLLSLNADAGSVEFVAALPRALGAAILAELLLRERVRTVSEGPVRLVESVSQAPIGDALVDPWSVAIANDKKRRSVHHWICVIPSTPDLKGRIARGLVQRGILGEEVRRVLYFFKRTTYPELDPEPERRLRARLRRAVLEPEHDVEPRTALLLSLAKGSGLLALVFDLAERARHKDRIEAIGNGEVGGAAAGQLFEATNSAFFVTCVLPTLIHRA